MRNVHFSFSATTVLVSGLGVICVGDTVTSTACSPPLRYSPVGKYIYVFCEQFNLYSPTDEVVLTVMFYFLVLDQMNTSDHHCRPSFYNHN